MNWDMNEENMGTTYKIRKWFEKKSEINLPTSLPLGDWKPYYDKVRAENPRKYFWGKTVPDFIEDTISPLTNTYTDVRYWMRHRFFDRYHIVHTGLKPDYYDCSTRMLHANMNLLRDYVEIELAWKNVVFDTEKKKEFKYPRFSLGWLRFRSFRCPDAGLDYLDWEIKLVNNEDMGYSKTDKLYGKPTRQAQEAREIKEIYNWWVNVYPNRRDPMDASGWSAYCDSLREEGGILDNLNLPPTKESKRALKALHKIEKDYAKEEENMLVRLMKIRQGLWT